MKLKTFLITASLWMGLLGLTACGDADVRTYQYPETAVLFDTRTQFVSEGEMLGQFGKVGSIQ